MPVDVVTETIIERPRVEVAAFAADPGNAPTWYANIKSVEWRSEPPLRVGSRIAFVAEFLGKRLKYTYEVVEFVPDERLVMRTAEGPFAMETTYMWAASGHGQHAHDPPQSRRAFWLLTPGGAAHGGEHAQGEPKGPGASEESPRGVGGFLVARNVRMDRLEGCLTSDDLPKKLDVPEEVRTINPHAQPVSCPAARIRR